GIILLPRRRQTVERDVRIYPGRLDHLGHIWRRARDEIIARNDNVPVSIGRPAAEFTLGLSPLCSVHDAALVREQGLIRPLLWPSGSTLRPRGFSNLSAAARL